MGAIAMERQASVEDAIILRPLAMSAGSIETNIDGVLAAVREKSRLYQDVSKYEGDDKKAKEDRALLRKQREMTKTTIASIQEAWNKPLEAFLESSRMILKEFDFAIDAIDEWVKEGERLEKDKKRGEIQAYFDGKGFILAPLERLFNEKWLNKTFKMADVKKEIDSAIDLAYANIKILEGISEHGAIAKALYLETLDMGAAMRQVEALRANAERLAREKAGREEREIQDRVSQNAREERREEREAAREDMISGLVSEALDLSEPEMQKEPEIIEYTLRFKGTRDQLLRLREYMTSLGISYEKV